MNALLATGLVLTLAGIAGYTAGVFVAYPGRALAVTGFMVGLTLLAIGRDGGAK